MNRAAWIDAVVGTIVIGVTAALGIISAYLAPAGWRGMLYGLCAVIAVLTAVQTLRTVRSSLRHEHALSELREGQAYLAQPEISRQFDILFRQHDAAVRRDDLFRENFDYDTTLPGATVVACRHCSWRIMKALAYAREDAVRHYENEHVPPETRASRLRRMLRA